MLISKNLAFWRIWKSLVIPDWYIKYFNTIKNICIEYDDLFGPERQEQLISFLGLFAGRDAIYDDQFEFAPDSDTEPINSHKF